MRRRRRCRRRRSSSPSARRRLSSTCSCAVSPRSSASASRTSTAQLMEQIAYLEDLLANPQKIDGLIKDDCTELKTEVRRRPPHAGLRTARRGHLRGGPGPAPARRRHDLRPRLHEARAAGDVPARRAAVAAASPAWAPATKTPSATSWCATRTTRCCSSPQRGRVYSLRGYEVPEASRQARGIPVVNLVEMDAAGPGDHDHRDHRLRPRLDGARDRAAAR